MDAIATDFFGIAPESYDFSPGDHFPTLPNPSWSVCARTLTHSLCNCEQPSLRLSARLVFMRIQALMVSSLIILALSDVTIHAQVTDSSSPNHVFAQFADGMFSDGTFYRSTLVVSSDSSTSTSCTATLHG